MSSWRSVAVLVAFLGAMLSPSIAAAQLNGHPFGLGLFGGDPSGVTVKYWFDQDNALQASLGWRAWHYEHTHGALLAVDWSYRFTTIQPRTSVVHFAVQGGAGGALGLLGDRCYHDAHGDTVCDNTNVGLYARFPFSFSAFFPTPQLEAFIEVAPGLRIFPDPWLVFMGGIGGRYYF